MKILANPLKTMKINGDPLKSIETTKIQRKRIGTPGVGVVSVCTG